MTTTYSIVDGVLVVTNTPVMPDAGNIRVDKELWYNGALNTDANTQTFTVGLFTDAEGTTRVQDVADKIISIIDGKGSVIFSGLDAGTYYVYEIDDEGSAIVDNGITAVINDSDHSVTYTGNEVTVTNGETAEVSIVNDQAPFNLNILKIRKTNENNDSNSGLDVSVETLDGAVFTLNRLEYNTETGELSHAAGSTRTVTTADGGRASFDGLAYGCYEIEETQSPAGYVKTGDGIFYIRVSDDGVQMITPEEDINPSDWDANGSTGDASMNNSTDPAGRTIYTATVENEPGVELPHTGGSGTMAFYIIGLTLVLAAGAMVRIRRRLIRTYR